MWSESEEPYEGAIWQLERTLNSPQSIARPHPYLMIGGGGEKKTLRLVAQYADACNLGSAPQAAHKLDVLRGHCDAVGRDYDDIEKTAMISVDPESTPKTVAATVRRARRARLHRDLRVRRRDAGAGAGRRADRGGRW